MASTRAAAAASAAAANTATAADAPSPAVSHPYTSLSHSIEKLDGSMATGKSNYVAWKFRVLRILKEKGLDGALQDANTPDSTSQSSTAMRVNDQAFTIISLNIRDSQIPHIQTARNAKEAWDSLAKVHQGIGSNGRMILMQRLWSLHLKEGQDMSAHLNSFKELSTQVANLSPNGIGIPDSDLVSMLSLSLPQSYEPLIMAVQSRADTITFDFLAGRLLQESTRRQAANKSNSEEDLQPLSAMAARSTFRSNGPNGRGNYRMANRGIGRGGFERGIRGSSSGSFRGRGITQGGVSGRCHYCNKEGHWKNECLKRKGDIQRGTSTGHLAFMGLSGQQNQTTTWIIDSGASRHLTANRNLFEHYINIVPTAITIGNGKEITAIGEGNITVPTTTGTILLAGVLHVPDIGSNLVSVASIVDQGFRVEFTNNICTVSKGKTVQGIGKREGNIYFLTGLQEVALAGLSRTGDIAVKEIWHRRLGHRSLSPQATAKLKQSVTGYEVLAAQEPVDKICAICMEGKQTRDKLTGERTKCNEILNTIHSDICGPMAVEGLMGERYFGTFIDERSGRIAISLLKHKSEIFDRFKEYQAKVERETGKRVKFLRSDGGGEYTGHTFQKYLHEKGITHKMTTPYTPEHNGVAERANRTIMEMVRCMLFDAGLGKEFWGYAALTAVHIINRLPGSTHNNKTPFEIWFSIPPSIGHLRVFGCKAYRHVPTATRRKLDPRTQKCRLIGYQEESGSRAYRVYDEQSKQVLITRDVVFEELAGKHLQSPGTQGIREDDAQDTHMEDACMGDQNNRKGGRNESSSTESTTFSEDEDHSFGDRLPPIDPDASEQPIDLYDKDTIVLQRPPPAAGPTLGIDQTRAPHPILRKSERIPQARQLFGLQTWPTYLALIEEPVSLEEALKSEDAVAWKAAWESELASLRKSGTWVVEKVPEKRNIVGCRWLFRKKEDGRFKVRLVAKGYSQEPGTDFNETFAPVAKFTTLRVILALVAENDWELHSMDVKTAFLNGELEEEIFMEYPEGVEEKPEPGYACRLLKAIYGLRQSPRAWYQKINTFFTNHDFHRSTQDYSLYINYEKRILVLVYVDDLVLAAAEVEDIGWIKACLSREFEMTDLGELQTFLGLEIQRDRSRRLLTLGQRKYIDRILERYGMQDARPSPTPLDPKIRLQISTNSETATTAQKTISLDSYQSAVGSLMYAMLGTRPDLAYAVGQVSQFNHAPEWDHWVAVKRIFRYLVGTKDYVLEYGTSSESGGYTDADWGSGLDRKSIGGFVFLLDGSAISWASKKQSSIALSTTEAEYMGMTQAAKEILWLRVLLQEIGAFKHTAPMSVLNADNQGAIALARNPEHHARTKHIDIQYHFIRNLVTTEKIDLRFCPSSNMVADIMTKGLPRTTHDKHTHGMGLRRSRGYGQLREGAC